VKLYDLLSSLLWLLVGLAFLAGGVRMGLGPIHSPGSGYFPAVIGGILSLLSLGLLIKTALEKGPLSERQPFWKEKDSWKTVSLVVGSLIFYMALLEFLGYMATTVLFIFFLLKIVGKKSWLVSITMAVLVSLCSYALFKMALGVYLPKGLILG
jgi:putative tricarboxylic transport membrane protein